VPRDLRPWADEPVRQRVPWATLAYLAGTTALVLYYVRSYSFLPDRVPQDVVDFWSFRIQELIEAPHRALWHLLIGVWANYYLLQYLYVTGLVAVFGVWFERHEGWLRTTSVFYGTSAAAGLVAGFVLLGLGAVTDSSWVQHELSRVWVGGSAGVAGLLGGVAARARRSWPWLLGAVVWEIGLDVVWLRSSTPLFHFSALAVGFAWVRWCMRNVAHASPDEDA
jgi:hypothetical protein